MKYRDNRSSPEKQPISRRKTLAALGTGTIGIPQMTSAKEQSASNSWNCSYDCPQEEIISDFLDLPDGFDYDRDGSVSVHWKESTYHSYRNGWTHIFSVSGGAASTTTWTGGEIYGQRYQLETSDGDLQPSTEANKHGQYPCDDEDQLIPDWGQPLMEAAIGTLSVGAAWFLAVGQSLRESMGHRPDGFEIFAGGFEYGDMATSLISPRPWEQCGFFHRVEFESNFYNTEVDVEMGFCTHDSYGATNWREFDGTIEFFGESGPNETAIPAETAHPEEMPEEMWEEYGIKDVRDESSIAGIEGDAGSVDYIATKSPLSLSEFEVTEKREAEMEDPYSERYRD